MLSIVNYMHKVNNIFPNYELTLYVRLIQNIQAFEFSNMKYLDITYYEFGHNLTTARARVGSNNCNSSLC